MNLRWCAFTGALMLLSAGITYMHVQTTLDPPGVTTRWWDGTTKSADTFYSNGKPESHIEYGDDGKTILVYKRWSEFGILVSEKIRLKDGKVEEKMFSEDGRVLLEYALSTVDGHSYIIRRSWFANGKMSSEELRTEDGGVMTDMRVFHDDGTLDQEMHILPNADNESRQYANGILAVLEVLHGSGDREVTTFHANGHKKAYQKDVRLDRSQLIEFYNVDGSLRLRREQSGDTGSVVVSVFSGEKLAYKQLLEDGSRITQVVEYSTETGLPTRTLTISNQAVISVQRFRADGSLERIRQLRGGLVVEQRIFDATGKTVVETIAGGEPESIDRILLKDAFSNDKERRGQ